MRVWYLLSILLDALAVPAQVYVSAALGAGDPDHARLVGRRSLALGLVAGCALAVLTAAMAPLVPAAFTHDPAIRHAATIALLVSALTQPLAALAFVIDGLVLGICDYAAMRTAMIVAALAYAPAGALVLALWLRPARHLARPRRLARRQIRDARPPLEPAKPLKPFIVITALVLAPRTLIGRSADRHRG